MSIQFSLNQIVAALICAALATLAYWVTGLLGGPALLALFVFGFVLVVLSVSIRVV